MTYEVNFTDPDKLPIVIPARTMNDTATDVALYGFTTLEYGKPLDETFLHLLENFSTPATGLGDGDYNVPTTDPLLNRFLTNPTEGQYWFNKTRNALYVYHTGEWHEIMMGSHIAANWGVTTHGQSIPRPISRFGHVFPYEHCSWSIAPRIFTDEPEWFVCMTDLNGVVNSRVRYVGASGLVPLEANYLILGVQHNSSAGSLRPAPCPPASLSIQRRLPSSLSTTVNTTNTISVDLEARPGSGTQGPVSYQWSLSGIGSDWTFTSTSALTDKRIIGTLAKADPTTEEQLTCTITCTITDACDQEAVSTVVITTEFELADLPEPAVANCARTIAVTIDEGDTVTRTNTLSVTRPTNATWYIDWDVAGITNDCADITHTVTSDTNSSLGLSFEIEGTTTDSCQYTIPYYVRDSVTEQISPEQFCTVTINRTVIPADADITVTYPCTIGTQIGNAGGPAVPVATEAASTTGGTAPYSYGFDTGAPGAGFDDSDCTTAGVTITSTTINTSTGVVSFDAEPPVAGTGECTIDMVTLATDSAGTPATDTVAHTQLLRWGTPASTYVDAVSVTCPAAVTLNSSGASAGTRTAAVSFPIQVFNNLAAVMTSGATVELEVTNGCGSDVSISSLPGVTTITSATTTLGFNITVPQYSDFTCGTLSVRVIARNSDTTWSTCAESTTCTITVTADSVVSSPLALSYRADLSSPLASCEACDGDPCGPTATIVLDVSGGTGPYELLPQTASSTAGTGWTLASLGCAASQHTVTVGLSSSRVTATVKMADGLTAQNCDGTIELKVRDSLGTIVTATRGFSLVRTVCPAPCYDVVPFTAGGAAICLGFYSSTTTPSTSCAGNGATSTTPTVFSPGLTSTNGPASGPCASLNSLSHAATIQSANQLVVDGTTVWWPRPAVKVSLKIVIPGVGEGAINTVVYRPLNYASANGTSTGTVPVTIAGRTFTATITLNVTYTGVTTIGGDCNNIHKYTASCSVSISPSMGACSSYTDPVTTTTSAPPGGPGGPGCFTRDMVVVKGDGSKAKIGSIVPGDILRTYNVPGMADETDANWRDWSTTSLDGGTYVNVSVASVQNLVRDHYYYINESIKVTGDHPFLVQRAGKWSWINAEDMKLGDTLLSSSRNPIPVTGLRRVESPGLEVVLLDVEHVDSYFAGATNGIVVLVHNKIDYRDEQ